MKRAVTAVSLLLAMLVALPLQAQSKWGLIGGISTGKMLDEFNGTDFTEDEDGLLGFVIGLTMQKELKNSLSFAPEAMFVSGKGFSFADGDGKLTMSYIEVPLLLRLGFATSGNIKPFLTAGPSLGFQLSCTATDEDEDFDCDEFFEEDESYKAFDAGLIVGGGLTRDRWSLNLRYDMGLTNIAEGPPGWNSKHRALMVLLGYAFR